MSMRTFRYFWLDWCEENRYPIDYFNVSEVGSNYRDMHEALVAAEKQARKTGLSCAVAGHFYDGRVRTVLKRPDGDILADWKQGYKEEYEVLRYEVEDLMTFPTWQPALDLARNAAAKFGVPIRIKTAYIGCEERVTLIQPDGTIEEGSRVSITPATKEDLEQKPSGQGMRVTTQKRQKMKGTSW